MIRSRRQFFITDFPASCSCQINIQSVSLNEDHVDSVSVSGESGNQELAADSIHGFAVKAFGDTPDTSFVYAFPSTAEILISFSSSQRSNASLSCTVK